MMQNDLPNRKIRVLIVDDHPTVREGLVHRISSQPDMEVCGEAADVREAAAKIPELGPDVAIVDIALRGSDGLDLVKLLKAKHPEVRAVVHSMYEEQVYAERCLRAGAMGYVSKESNPSEVVAAIRAVLQGRVHVSEAITHRILGRSAGAHQQLDPVDSLTDRQLEIFRLFGQGKTAAQIAKTLHLSVHTVESHRENIKRKLKVDNVSELTRLAVLWSDTSRREL